MGIHMSRHVHRHHRRPIWPRLTLAAGILTVAAAAGSAAGVLLATGGWPA